MATKKTRKRKNKMKTPKRKPQKVPARVGKRPPRSLYIAFHPDTGDVISTHRKQAHAKEECTRTGLEVAGPYYLAERVGVR